MVGNHSLQNIDRTRPVYMVVNRAKDASRLDGHPAHSKLASCHTLDFGAKVNGVKYLYCDTICLGCCFFMARCLLSMGSIV